MLITYRLPPLFAGPELGPGAYAAEDPNLLVEFGGHRRAPGALFGADKQTGREDAVGPYGQRPEAAIEAGESAL